MNSIKLIGEIGINHNSELSIAYKLMDISKFSGLDLVKFQKRDPDLMPDELKNTIKDTIFGRMTYYEYKKKLEFGAYEYTCIDSYCKKLGIDWFLSVWDLPSARFAKDFNCKMVKIPSAKITNLELLDYCRDNFELKLMSTGMSTEEEIEKAVEVLKPQVIFHTNSSYPSKPEHLRLDYIFHLKGKYPTIEIGYSGHEFGLVTTFATVYTGVKWIERHITLDHDMPGSDQKASVEPVGLIKLVKGIRDIEKSMTGFENRICYPEEKDKLYLRG